MTPPALLIENLAVSFQGASGGIEVLKGVDLRAEAGERIGIVGSSGVGKTTLMMVAAGLQKPNAGRVAVGGEDLSGLSDSAITRLRSSRIGVVFQNFHLIGSMTALENVMIPLEFADEDKAEDRAREVLDSVGLGRRLDHYPGQLSGGEQQRVAIARAIVRKPALMLADEPTGNLDEENGATIIDALFGLAGQNGSCLVLITHDRRIAGRCDRVLLMRDGKLDGVSSLSESGVG